MVSEAFKAAFKAELEAKEQKRQEEIAKHEAAARKAQADLDWFHAHMEHQIEQAVVAIQSVDPEKRILAIAVMNEWPKNSPPGRYITVTIHGGPYGSYTRTASCLLKTATVELAPEASSYARSNGQRSDERPRTAVCARSSFSADWLTKALETFVMHVKENPRKPL